MGNKHEITAADVVYISGPMSGLPDANRSAFIVAEHLLQKKFGCRVLNPAYMPDGFTYREYMVHALLLMQHATAMVILPDSCHSLGVQIELAIAWRDKLPVWRFAEIMAAAGGAENGKA